MKHLLLLVIGLCLLACEKPSWEAPSQICVPNVATNPNHQLGKRLQDVLDNYADKGLPGISMAVASKEGLWAGSSGYAKIEDDVAMQPCHLLYGQSVAKTYMAVAMVKLSEEGRVDLSLPITHYLPQTVADKIDRADEITVEMLLYQTSGIPEYNIHADYVSGLFQHPLESVEPEQFINYVDGKPLSFEPGSEYRYRNTNYVLLAMIANEITGDHTAYIRHEILEPAGLKDTYYHNTDDFLDNDRLVNSYWDRYSNGVIENNSEMQKANVKTLIGDDGIIATPLDYVLFLQALFNHEIVSEASLDQMLTFNHSAHNEYGYGMGIHRDFYNGFVEYGHSGGGLGAGCYLAYFPEKECYFFLGVNIGTIIDGPILRNAADLQTEVWDLLVE